jgi:hypothetical protein
MMKQRALLLLLLAAAQVPVYARGVTPYLPLNLDPEAERQIERVMILAGRPVMTRPIPAAAVLDALPKACRVDLPLCERVRTFLQRYMHNMGIEFASIEGSASSGSDPVMPNQHGQTEQSRYQIAGAGYLQPSDYALLNIGAVAYEGRTTPTGSMLSLGFDWAQLDLGYRDHWWSPVSGSSMLISTEAPTMPSVTISNYDPLTSMGIEYEVFAARMSYTNKIELINGDLTSGYPRFSGLHLGIEPGLGGWSLAANRVIIFGGGAAGGQSLRNIVEAFFDPTKAQTTGFGTEQVIGKQEASLTSQFMFPGQMPFTVYFEYAGNDTGGGYSFSKTDLTAGIHFPRVGPFDLTYEISEWQPTWYVHAHTNVETGYGDGITNDGLSIGHWFGDQRVFGDAVGGQSNMLRVGYEPQFGGRLEAQLLTLVNDSYYSEIPYYHEYMGSLSYSHPWREFSVGGEVDYGRDVFGGRFTRIAAFLRFGDAMHSSEIEPDDEAPTPAERPDGAELFVNAGVVASRVIADITSATPRVESGTGLGPYLAFGARRAVSDHQDLGVALEGDGVHGSSLLGARILDYRYRFDGPLALNIFAGAARYAAATPAYGFYFGGGPQWRNILPGWDVGLEYRYAAKVDRVRVLPTDPQGGYRPDAYYDFTMGTVYISRKF